MNAAPPLTATPPPARRPRTDVLAELLVGLEPGGWFQVACVTWADYQRLMAVRDDNRRGVRLFFDRGRLEVMSHSRRHERWKMLLTDMLARYLTEAGIPYTPTSHMTFEREDLDRGFEPDGCFYLRPSADLLTEREIDFFADPPPDLIVEVEVSRSADDRLPVYAAFGIPEVWRFDGTTLTVLRLRQDGVYEPAASRAVPAFPFAVVPRYLGMLGTVDHGRILLDFQQFVRALLTPPGTP